MAKMKSFFEKIRRKFKSPNREIEEIEADETTKTGSDTAVPETTAEEMPTEVVSTGDMWTKLKQHKKRIRKIIWITAAVAVVAAAVSLGYLFLHTATSFQTLEQIEQKDNNGTTYTNFGENLIRYSSDGVSSVNGNGTVQWSSTYSMQTPMIDICETTAAVAEKEGTQVYIYNESGELGQFQTTLPIEKIKVASQGVVAVVLQDADVTWVNFYDTKGTQIAEHRTTIGESGYPLDIALSPDGLKIMISYLCFNKGIMNTKVCFYNFDSVGQAAINNMVSSQTYENSLVPRVVFAQADRAVAFRSSGFSIFSGKQIPELEEEVEFEEEILSMAYDDQYMVFVFTSEDKEYKYKMQVYDMKGKRISEKYLNLDYKQVKVERGQVLIFNEKEFHIYDVGGRVKFTGSYGKPIRDILNIEGFGKYMVLTPESTDLIRLN